MQIIINNLYFIAIKLMLFVMAILRKDWAKNSRIKIMWFGYSRFVLLLPQAEPREENLFKKFMGAPKVGT